MKQQNLDDSTSVCNMNNKFFGPLLRSFKMYSVLSPTLWDCVDLSLQTPLSKGFFRQQYWSGLPFPPPRDLPDPVIKPTSPALAGGFFLSPILLLKLGVL